jgi:hypothetical protein
MESCRQRGWRIVGGLEKNRNCRTGEGEDGGCFLDRRAWRIKRIGGLDNERLKENVRKRGWRKMGGLEKESRRKNWMEWSKQG